MIEVKVKWGGGGDISSLRKYIDIRNWLAENNIPVRAQNSRYHGCFPVEVDLMIEEWTSESEDPAFNERPEVRKKRVFAMIVPPNRLHRIESVLKELTPYKADPRAKVMINYLTNALNVLQLKL